MDTIVELSEMAGTKLALMLDGDAGFICALDDFELIASAYHGDFVRMTAKLVRIGHASRIRRHEAHVLARCHGVGKLTSHREVLETPLLVARPVGTAVTPLDLQRITPAVYLPS